MMLCASLANMMDRCGCFIFVNSEQSLKLSSINTESSKETFSPWIFFELSLFHKIQKTPLASRILHKRANVIDECFSTEHLKVAFPAETRDLRTLNISTIDNLSLENIKGKRALIKLHAMLFPEQY